MDLATVFKQGDGVLIVVFCLLILMSIITWTLIAIRFREYYRTKKCNTEIQNRIWITKNWEDVEKIVILSNTPAANITEEAIKAKKNYTLKKTSILDASCSFSEFLTRTIRRKLTEEIGKFDYGLTALASIGATVPFIGLFGTVWGIYRALINMGEAGQMTMTAVADPIGEALVATAAGLATAIPAVLAYNALSRLNKVLIQNLDHFSSDIYHQLIFCESDMTSVSK